MGGLVKGWLPTLIGYSIQGAGKFGLYEYFKKCVELRADSWPPAGFLSTLRQFGIFYDR